MLITNTLPTPAKVGHQRTESTNIGCNQWLSLAKIALKVPLAGRNHSLMANTSMCGEGINVTGMAPSTLFTNQRSAVNGGSNHMCTYRGWPNKHPTLKGAMVSAKIILPTIYMATMTPSISLVPTYQLWSTWVVDIDMMGRNFLSCDVCIYVNVISTAHGLAPSIIACSLQPRHGSVLGQLERETSEGDGDQNPGQWYTPSWIRPQSDSPHSSGRLNLGALEVVFYIIIVVGAVVLRGGGGFSPGSENHSHIMRVTMEWNSKQF